MTPSEPGGPPGLDELRSQLDALDRRVLEAIAQRQQLVSEIGNLKREAAIPTRDFDRERDVVELSRAVAVELGLAPDLAEQVMLQLIRGSLTTQEQERVAATSSGHGKRVMVIGGRGQMGSWFVRFLASQGFDVEVADPAGALEGFSHYANWQDVDLNHDIVVVAAQLRQSEEILATMAQNPPSGLVFDIGSLKSPLRGALTALVTAGARVTSLHPMFGPATELLSGRHVVFVDVGVPQATQQARELFASTMAIQVDMDLDSHDRLIAYVLGLSHALSIAFAAALAESGEDAPTLAQLSSTTFDSQLEVTGRVVAENPHLYFEIQSLNDYGGESLSALSEAVGNLRKLVEAGDESAFLALMEKGREYLAVIRPQ
ncbi:MAG: prephenate dehydrogenase/arogenate dehydrogenase family protein [Acidimicrobiia bacterium]|nr:prephenate dehydrogenase/arogenate dehydrogenase family protein [Acidimicrobiia bacterium]